MHLSPFAQYYTRKLLRQNVDRASHSLSKDSFDSVLIKLNLNHVLSDLYQTKLELTTKIWELEALTQICQELEKNHYEQENLAEVKKRIFDLLGFKAGVAFPSKLPTILQEKPLSPFRVYGADTISEAVTYEGEIYGLVKQLDLSHRLQVYQLVGALSAKDIPLLLTTSSSRLAIWIHLRSPSYSVLRDQERILSSVVMSLHSRLHRFKHHR